MRHSFLGLLVFFVVAALLWRSAEAIIVNNKVVHSDRFLVTFESFAMESGADVEIKATVVPRGTYPEAELQNAVKIFVCPERRYAWLVADSKSSAWICGPIWNGPAGSRATPSLDECHVVSMNSSSQSLKMTLRTLYRFSIINCLRDAVYPDTRMAQVDVTVSYTAVNPGGEQLPVGSGLLPLTFSVITALWATAVVMWGIYITFRWRLRNAIHRALWFTMGLKVCATFAAFIFWRHYASDGTRLDFIAQTRNILFAASEGVVFSVFILIAKGWLITRHTLPAREIRAAALTLVLLLASLLFLSFYSDEYYYMAMLIMYFFMLPKITSALSRNSRLLDLQLSLMEQMSERQLRAPDMSQLYRHIVDKATVFHRLRRIVSSYIVALLLINSIRLMSYWEFDWILSGLNELTSFLVLITVALVLGPQRSGVFAVLANNAPLLLDWRRLLEDAGIAIGDPDFFPNFPQVEPWDVTKSFIVEWPRKVKTTPIQLALATEATYAAANIEG